MRQLHDRCRSVPLIGDGPVMVDRPVLGDHTVHRSLGRFVDLANENASGDRIDQEHL